MDREAQRPNVLLIVMDATRANHLSCYGYPLHTTPNLDHLATEGVRYENAISAGGWTIPSHASLFTGTFPSAHGARDGNPHLNEDVSTLAEILSAYDYQTAGFTNIGWLTEDTGLTRGFETFVPIFRLYQEKNVLSLIRRALAKAMWVLAGCKLTGATTTNRYIKRWLARREDDQPFFIFINYSETHTPYRPPHKYARRFLAPYNVRFSEAQQINQSPIKHVTGSAAMSEKDLDVLRALYDAELAYLDSRLGELFEHLDRQGILDNTIVIVTADHGENIGDHGFMGHKWCLYDSLLKVPLIIRYPSGTPKGISIEEQVQLVDVFPTILKVLDIPAHSVKGQLQGFSLLPDGSSSRSRQYAIAEMAGRSLKHDFRWYPEFDYTRFERDLKVIRTDRFKYIWASNGDSELYDIVADPGELHNIIDSLPDEAQRLHKCLFDFIDSIKCNKDEEIHESIEMDHVLEQHLRDLGYID